MLLDGLTLVTALFGANITQVQAAGSNDPIIVEGQRIPTVQQALDDVTEITASVESQLARYTGDVCPSVVGVVPEEAALIEARMRLTMSQVGVVLAPKGCEANLLLAIVPDGSQFVSELRTKRPMWFQGVPAPEIRKLLRETKVRSWSVTGVFNEDGQRLDVRGNTTQGTSNYERQGNQNLASMRQVEVWSPSFSRKQTRYVIEGAVVVIDAAATKDLTVRQIADYAVFRGLTKTRPPENGRQVDSILAIFGAPGTKGPLELTRFDRLYLGEMYQNLKQKGFESAVHERSRIASAIASGRLAKNEVAAKP